MTLESTFEPIGFEPFNQSIIFHHIDPYVCIFPHHIGDGSLLNVKIFLLHLGAQCFVLILFVTT